MTTQLPDGNRFDFSPIPPLESGDRLTRPEFERRYQANPNIHKAELIEGIVYVASPLRFQQHAEPHSFLVTWLGTYIAFTPGVRSGIEPTVRLDLDNEFQPDIVLILDKTVGGRAKLTPDGYLEGVPELVVEIAASSAAIDLENKQQVYRRNGVLEYVVWQFFEEKFDWFVLVDGEYQLLSPDEGDRVIRSQTFPGLWLDVDALFTRRMSRVLKVLQQGLSSPGHANFLEQLENKK